MDAEIMLKRVGNTKNPKRLAALCYSLISELSRLQARLSIYQDKEMIMLNRGIELQDRRRLLASGMMCAIDELAEMADAIRSGEILKKYESEDAATAEYHRLMDIVENLEKSIDIKFV